MGPGETRLSPRAVSFLATSHTGTTTVTEASSSVTIRHQPCDSSSESTLDATRSPFSGRASIPTS